MFKVMNGMFGKYGKILKQASFESTIVVTVNGNMENSTKVKNTEEKIEDYFPRSRNNIE